ncbi:MAG: hypothetical protein OXC91_07175, partial [Rhodobacteraceae bacterium]|nr:hypothetical protein [Paracoccaceae bacterium]
MQDDAQAAQAKTGGHLGGPCRLRKPRNSSLGKGEVRPMKHPLLKLIMLGTLLVSAGANAQN